MSNWRGLGLEGQPTQATLNAESEESRQQYANIRIRRFQLAHPDASFSDILSAFRYFGTCYDQGYRLRHEPGWAA